MSNLRDSLMKPEDIHDCFNTQTDVLARLEATNKKMVELNQLSEQKFKRVQKSFVNAASMLEKMQADLGFIHGAIKKLTHLSTLEKSAVDRTTAIVQSKTGEIDVPVSKKIEEAQPAETKNEVPEQKVEEQKIENVIEENKTTEEVHEPQAKVEGKTEEEAPAATIEQTSTQAQAEKSEEATQAISTEESEAKAEEAAPEASTEESKTETQEEKAEETVPAASTEEKSSAAEEEKTEEEAPAASTEETNTGGKKKNKKKNKK